MQKLDGPRLLPASGSAPTSIVVLVHGYGSNGADLISLAPMWQARFPDTLFIAPNAPERCPGAPGGFQWWGLDDHSRTALLAGATGAAAVLDGFLDELLAEHGLREDRLALVGFSQGTMMALHVGVRRARPLAGILGFSGMIAGPGMADDNVRSKPPVLLIHGSADPVLPVASFHHAMAELQRLGFEVEGQVTPGLGHSVDMAGIEQGARFLQRVLT